MIADLTQLDEDVFVVGYRVAFLDHGLLQQISVDALLLLSDTGSNVDFNFRRESLLDFFLDSPQ